LGVARFGFGMRSRFTLRRASMPKISERFSFRRYVATSTGTWQWMAAVFSFIASSCRMRSTCSAVEAVSRM